MHTEHFFRTFLKTYWGEICAFCITAAASLMVFCFSADRFPNDDQFILYRYIDNLAGGNGFVYNIGEHVLGSTTPLFTLLCTLCKYVLPFISTPTLVSCINIALLSISGVFFYKLSRLFFSQSNSLLVVLVFALNLSRTIPEGMETPLFLLTFLMFLYYVLTERFYRSSVLLSLTLLTRPDAGLIAVLAALYWWQKVGWRTTLRLVTVCVVVALPWLLFSTWYFGSFIPQSLATKLHSHDIYRLSALQGAKIQLAALSRIYWGRLFDPDSLSLQTLCNLLPLLVLGVLGVWKKLTKDSWILLAVPVLYFLSFSISNPIIFPWYLSEMEPLWILLSMLGALYLAERIASAHLYSRTVGNALKILFLAGIVVGPLVGWAQLVSTASMGSKVPYFNAGAYIQTHEARGDSIGIADIGIVGYITRAHIIDFIGLVNTTSVSYYPIQDDCVDKKQIYTIPPKLIEATRPTWLVASLGQMEPCLLVSQKFLAEYQSVYQSGNIHVWKLAQKSDSKR